MDRKSFPLTTGRRTLGFRDERSIREAVFGSKDFVQRMKLDKTLDVHRGCVNTISWSKTGQLILSGSDDKKLCFTNPYSKEVVATIPTSHRSNIFCAKFLPDTGDKQVVSCSGDGCIIYSDVESPQTYGRNTFNCHYGTAYKVITLPSDPNTFMSCGEDGAVRWFDLRIKSSCSKEDCKEDVMINCRRAVTGICVNPVIPYHLAVGCSDSSVRIFDRRMLGTKLTGNNTCRGAQGVLCRFCPSHLQNKYCRPTSISYSANGQDLLVSYSSDYIYLFGTNARYKKDRGETLSGGADEGLVEDSTAVSDRDESSLGHPVKRLRLRGDWSDTGPRARPRSEIPEEERPRPTMVQRMSEMLSRWLEESGSRPRRPEEGGQADTPATSSSSTASIQRSSSSQAQGAVSSEESSADERSHGISEHNTRAESIPGGAGPSSSSVAGASSLSEIDPSNSVGADQCISGGVGTSISSGTESSNPSGLGSSVSMVEPSTPESSSHQKMETDCETEKEQGPNGRKQDGDKTKSAVFKDSAEARGSLAEMDRKMDKGSEVKECKKTNNGQMLSGLHDTAESRMDMTSVSETKVNRMDTAEGQEIEGKRQNSNSSDLNPSQKMPGKEGSSQVQLTECKKDGQVGRVDDDSTRERREDVVNEEEKKGIFALGERMEDRNPQPRLTKQDSIEHVRSRKQSVVNGPPLSDMSDAPGTSQESKTSANKTEGIGDDGRKDKMEAKMMDEGDKEGEGRKGRENREKGPASSQGGEGAGGGLMGASAPTEVTSSGQTSKRRSCSSSSQSMTCSESDSDEEMQVLGPEREKKSPQPQEPPTQKKERVKSEAELRLRQLFKTRKEEREAEMEMIKNVYSPDIEMVYKGHRNSRTMIKEANFWGDHYIVSGSDCGHIFFWDRYTGELIMLLEGDKHVVNCIQPHPFDPLLATSGIDYNVKLWSPLAQEPGLPDNATEVMRINELMLEETRDTITVPPSFMLRMLASLNHFRGERRSSPDPQSTSESSDD